MTDSTDAYLPVEEPVSLALQSSIDHSTLPPSRKQFLVFSSAGKPIYSYHGNEESLSTLMATARALMSVASDALGESLRYSRCGQRVVAFLDRSPVCLVAVSTLAEPPPILRMQLALLHGQLASLLTASAIDAIYTKNPGFDIRRLLAGADTILTSLIDSYIATPAVLLGAYPTMPLLRGVRLAIIDALKIAVNSSEATFGLILGSEGVVAIAHRAGAPLTQQWDVLLLINFLRASQESLRLNETFTPLCLPHYNPKGHLHTYIHYIDSPSRLALLFLTGGANPNFHALSAARLQLTDSLSSSGALATLQDAAQAHLYGTHQYRIEDMKEVLEEADLDGECVYHAVYKLTRRQQYFSTPWSSSDTNGSLQQDVIVAFSQMRAAMYEHSSSEHITGPLETLRYELRSHLSLLAMISPNSELFLAMKPGLGKAEAVKIGGEVLKWLIERHGELFFGAN